MSLDVISDIQCPKLMSKLENKLKGQIDLNEQTIIDLLFVGYELKVLVP